MIELEFTHNSPRAFMTVVYLGKVDTVAEIGFPHTGLKAISMRNMGIVATADELGFMKFYAVRH